MTGTIVWKEVRDLSRDGRLRWMGIVILTLLAGAAVTGGREYHRAEQERQAAAHAERVNWETQGVKNPHSAAHYGVYAFKPQLALSALDTGTNAYTGVSVWLEAHKQNEFKYKPARDANSLARFGQMTVATVLQVLAPLLIVLASFAAITGEKEQGTLRQLLSAGVSRRQLAWGKTAGTLAALGLILVPAAVLGAAGMLLFSTPDDARAMAGRGVVFVWGYVAYFAAFAGVSLAVSAWAKSSRAALTGLLGFWILNCLVAPRVAADVARQAVRTPSSFEFSTAMEHDMKNGMDGHAPQEKRMAEVQARLLKRYGAASVKELPVNITGVILDESEKYGNLVFDRHYGELWDRFERQADLHQAAGAVAPLLAVRSLSMALAGTDYYQHRHFAAAAEGYRREFLEEINRDITHHAAGVAGPYVRGADLWKQIAPFRYEAPGLGWVLVELAWSLGVLAVWSIGAPLVAVWSAARMGLE